LANSPNITKALFSDETWELYEVESTDTSGITVLLLRHPQENFHEPDRMKQWWAAQPEKLLTVVKVLSSSESAPFTLGAVLALRGHNIKDLKLALAKQESLRRLFVAMLDCVERAITIDMYPDFNHSFFWVADDEDSSCALAPLDICPSAPVDQVRGVAQAFYRFVTGMEYSKLAGCPPPLLRWSRFAGDDLSRIVDNCLLPSDEKCRIVSTSRLGAALGRQSDEACVVQNKSISHPPNAGGRGLDKVAGMHSLKELLRHDVIEPVRNPEPYRRYGLSIPNGILLYGPPGCGKTYIARQLAEELGHHFVEIIPSELASPYIHGSVIRIRELFEDAAEQAPSVLFIDEFEALVPSRADLGGFQQHKAEEVNEFLTHLSSSSDKNIFIIAATNRPEMIDPAVRRTGRLDKLIYVGPPDAEARCEMLKMNLEGRPVVPGFSLKALAEALLGYSASDIRFVVDEAARDAMRRGTSITNQSFDVAMSKIQPSVSPQVETQYQSIEQRG
jgi:ATP-dependent 26S proteasome regulatory subunit